ncbi:MAG: hypothetical protein JEZ10_04415 [Verrucomicrobia bacterium]|nr:hypothetical protein [Verrucomicrobiota bacterium]
MQRLAGWVTLALLMSVSGFAEETIISKKEHVNNGDVVLESAVQEIKDAPMDAANVVGDTFKFVADEVRSAGRGVKDEFSGSTPHEKTRKAAELELENAWNPSDDIVFRSYKVSDEIGKLLLSGVVDESASVDVSSFFDDVTFPEEASAYYMPNLNSLLVYHTMENILAIETTLADYQGAHRELLGYQVEIETKFIEVNQKTLDELGFSWRFNNDNGGPLKIINNLVFPENQDILADGLRTTALALNGGTSAGVLAISRTTGGLQWDLFISALEQVDDADVLSAPRVVTLDGNTATIHVGERQMMPKSFEINTGETSPFVEPTDWENEQLGVYLEVTPEIREEGLIDLDLNLKVVDIIGYDEYEVVPRYSGCDPENLPTVDYQENNNPGTGVIKDYLGQAGNVVGGFIGLPFSPNRSEYYPIGNMPSVSASLPYYRVREMETRVTVADGSTVGMGGLIYDKLETYRDKVPVLGSIPYLGRLFRSEGEQSIKRNLMIFVTATQVDVDGRRSADVALKN